MSKLSLQHLLENDTDLWSQKVKILKNTVWYFSTTDLRLPSYQPTYFDEGSTMARDYAHGLVREDRQEKIDWERPTKGRRDLKINRTLLGNWKQCVLNCFFKRIGKYFSQKWPNMCHSRPLFSLFHLFKTV